jgi:hypothetical protein
LSAQLVVAADGMLAKHPELLEQLPFSRNSCRAAIICT